QPPAAAAAATPTQAATRSARSATTPTQAPGSPPRCSRGSRQRSPPPTGSPTEPAAATAAQPRSQAAQPRSPKPSPGRPATPTPPPGPTGYLHPPPGPDNVGNTASISTTVKVDTTGPSAPSVSLSAAAGNTYISGSTVYINAQAGKSGSFQASATSTDS